MNILNIEHVSKVFGEKTIFDDVSFGIQEGDKIGIIGINGTGKTTLLRMIAGVEEPDSGQIIKQNGIRLAYLSQHPSFPEGATVLSYAFDGIAENDWALKSEVKSALNKLGITDHDMKMEHLSGGQKKKVALAKTLTSSFEILLLDEPTNHLDGEMISWLEDYLKRYKGVVIMVTHDRYFLDKVTNRILEISRGKLYGYEANYSKFLEMKAEREEMELASERKRQSVLRMELEWAKRGCRARTTKQKARLERLELLKNGKAPETDRLAEIDSVETRMGKKTIELHHVSKSYGERKLIDDFDYIVLKNQNLGIVGPNGCGKSTLLKMIAGLVEPDEGTIEIGETIRIGYFAQELPEMNTSQRVIDFVKDIAEYIPTKDGRITASQMLERFLFTPDMQYAPIEKLSGGEKKRLYLLSILQAAPNVLLFDEANNDIDIPTMTILEDYLNSFQGIVITVSHDRYFLDNVVDRIFEFDENGHLQQYEGGYTDYIEAKQRRELPKEEVKTKKSTGKNDWKQNRPTKLKFSYMEQKEFETIDEDIAKLEEKLEKLDADMMANATNSAKLSELTLEKEFAEKQLEEKMERWVYLNDLAERIAAQ
ncbi:ABC-F family ATP-binding cassette domain-containing protein [Tyzzerella nexilis]|nr:ABC-F family ATP-binding cassette domain-containing protein [[Clostridium] nexile]MCB7555831.1 ABC-F family ATP-binding cassette domain-containing protein [[Clostridium] nexile]NSD84706.1 ABC-F family ATP-binding cassette domain-containing protein [[Clostridium] nexile]NSD87160.1 ABC-F family ATP-binding cassette domain-containing protein [[Clostridium] nexile]